jgi:hypothetical protein
LEKEEIKLSKTPKEKIVEEKEIEKEITQLKEKLPKEFIKEYEIFSEEVAYRDIWYYSRLPVRTLFIPEGTKINRVEAYLEALNFDPANTRDVGIAIGLEIPDDCQAGYYLTLGPKETAKKQFDLETDLFQTGTNQITAWISTPAEWGGGVSWVSLMLKIHYQGESPKILEKIEVLKGLIDPIECMLRGIYRDRVYKYEIKYPKNWGVYPFIEGVVDFYPPGVKPQLGGRGRIISISVINWWYPEGRTYEEWLDFLIKEYPQLYFGKKDIIFGEENYKGIEMREKRADGSIRRSISLVRNSLVYNFTLTDENSPYISVFNQMLSTFRFLE